MPRVKTDVGPFAIVPGWIFEAVSPQALRLFVLMAYRWADREGEAFPSRPTMAEAMGVTTKTVDRAIFDLVAAEALEVVRRTSESGDPTSNLYRLRLSRPADVREDVGGRDTDEATPGDTDVATGRDTDVPLTIPTSEPEKTSPSGMGENSPDWRDGEGPIASRFVQAVRSASNTTGVVGALFEHLFGIHPNYPRIGRMAKKYGGPENFGLKMLQFANTQPAGDPHDYIEKCMQGNQDPDAVTGEEWAADFREKAAIPDPEKEMQVPEGLSPEEHEEFIKEAMVT